MKPHVGCGDAAAMGATQDVITKQQQQMNKAASISFVLHGLTLSHPMTHKCHSLPISICMEGLILGITV